MKYNFQWHFGDKCGHSARCFHFWCTMCKIMCLHIEPLYWRLYSFPMHRFQYSDVSFSYHEIDTENTLDLHYYFSYNNFFSWYIFATKAFMISTINPIDTLIYIYLYICVFLQFLKGKVSQQKWHISFYVSIYGVKRIYRSI